MLVKNICCVGSDRFGVSLCCVIALKCPEIDVYIVDYNEEIIMQWNSENLSVFEEFSLNKIVKECRDKNLVFTSDIESTVKKANIIFICEPTPMNIQSLGKTISLKFIEDTARIIAKTAEFDKIIVETRATILKSLEAIKNVLKANHKRGLDFQLLSNPEFVSEGNIVKELLDPDRIVIGYDKTYKGIIAAKSLVSVYEHWVPKEKIVTTDNVSAKLSKLATTAFLAQKILNINTLSKSYDMDETGVLFSAIGMDSRIGSKFLNPSIIFQNPEFHQDLKTLVELSEFLDLPKVANYWEQILHLNDAQKTRFFKIISETYFNSLTSKTIAVFGFSLDKNNVETGSSLALFVCRKLYDEGSLIVIFDPVLEATKIMEALSTVFSNDELNNLKNFLRISDDPYKATKKAHGIVFCTDEDVLNNYNYSEIYEEMMKPAHIFDAKLFLPHEKFMKIGFCIHTTRNTFTPKTEILPSGNSPSGDKISKGNCR